MAFAAATAFLFTLVPAAIEGIRHGYESAKGLTPPPPLDLAAFAPYGTIGLQAILLWGALRGAAAAAGGNISAGLANRPVKRRGLVTVFAMLILVWDVTAIAALVWMVQHGGHAPTLSDQLAKMPRAAGAGAIHIALLSLLAPVAEELFFRGWLWGALRKTWSPAPVLCCTSGLWLAMHLLDGSWRAILLLPTAILLGLARHHGDSVRASLWPHLMNNSLVVLIQIAALLPATPAGAG